MKLKEKMMMVVLSSVFCLGSLVSVDSHAKKVEERPGAIAMAADVALMRPLMFVATVGGAGIYVLSLPFSLLGGNAEEVQKALVITPFKSTFVRCLGCTSKHLEDREEYY
jgi:hypothetical protein